MQTKILSISNRRQKVNKHNQYQFETRISERNNIYTEGEELWRHSTGSSDAGTKCLVATQKQWVLIQFFSWSCRSRCLWTILAKSSNLRVDWSWNIQCWRRINATNWVRPKQCQPHWHSADTGDGQQRRAQRRHGHAVTTPDPLLLSTTLFLSILPCHSVLAVVNGIIIFVWKISAELLIPRRLKTKLLPTLQIWSSLLMILMSFLLIKGKIYILAWALIYILLMISTGCFYYSWYIILL